MSLDPTAAAAILDSAFAPWVRALDIRFDRISTDIDTGSAALSIPLTPEITRMGGIICGQALATLADTAMVFACFAHLGEARPIATTNLDTQFLRAGKGARVRCDASVVRAGRALIFARADLFSLPDEQLIATATATFYNP